jgi:D-lactate dehydrogenase (cytochrome)
MVRSHPDQRIFTTDQAVPISAYPALIGFIESQRKERGVVAYMFGHAGDGNIHVFFPFTSSAEYEERQRFNDEIVMKAIELGGTVTGEHGVGMGKGKFLPVEHGAAAEVMRSIKQLLDPNGILNPGKIFPQENLPN